MFFLLAIADTLIEQSDDWHKFNANKTLFILWTYIKILFILPSFSMLHMYSSSLPTRPGRTCGFWSAPLTLGKHTSHGSSLHVSNPKELFIIVFMCYVHLKKPFMNIVWPSVIERNALWEWKCGLSEKGQVLALFSGSRVCKHTYCVVLFVTEGYQ